MAYPERAIRRPDDPRSDAEAAADAEALARTVPEYVAAQEKIAGRKRRLPLIKFIGDVVGHRPWWMPKLRR